MEFLKLSKYNLVKIYVLFFTSILFLLGFSTAVSAQKKYTVVLDAGHGGKDSGASRGKYKEKKIALQVVLDVGKELLTAKDINVVYTRKTDNFIELHNRAKIANDKKADLFVSIHCNANNSTKPHGAETYVLGLNGNKENLEISRKENAVILLEDNYKQNYDYDPNSPESLIGLSVLQEENLDLSLGFGGLVQTNFKNLKRYNRKVKQANFLVLRETVMPSVLIELGFLSNKEEGKFLNSRKGQIKMAKAIAKAIVKYINRQKLNKVQDNYIAKTTKKRPPLKVVVTPNKKKTSNKKTVTQKKIPTKEKVVVKKEVKKPIAKKVVKKVSAGIKFKVQIAASRKYIKEASYNFKGLKNVELMFIDNYYKYYYGSTAVFKDIKKQLIIAKKVGFKDAWIVAFKDGRKISIKEALKNL